MACVSLDAGDADRSKRFKHSAQTTPGAPAMFPEQSNNVQFGHQDAFQGPLAPAYAIAADKRPGAVEVPAQQPALAPPASTTVVPSPLALPAASQQYPVLPQAAASAAAATAAVLQGQEAALRQHRTQIDDSFAAAGKQHTHALDPLQQQQQQRRRAGPANQWRPGMPLLAQQPAQAFAAPQQAAAVPSTQQLQWPPGSLAQQILQGGALGAALQKLLPLPGQLMATQQQHQAAGGPSAFSVQQQQAQQALQHQYMRPQLLAQHTQQSAPTGTQQRPLHILQGIPAAVPAGTPVLVPSAPQGPQNRALPDSAGPAAAAGGGAVAAGDTAGAAAPCNGTTAGPSAAADPGASHGVSSSPAASGGPEGPDESRAGWLKLLSCVVDPQGDSLALELLLAGQLYKGHLTRVTPADTAPPAAVPAPAAAQVLAAAAAAAAAASAAAGHDGGQAGARVGDASEAAAVLDFAQQREGMCFLCALPFAKQAEGATPGQTLAQAAAVQTALANNEAGAAAAALAGSADGTGAAASSQADDSPAPAAAAQPQGSQLAPQPLQQQQQTREEHKGPAHQDQQHKESSMLAALGPAVLCELGPGCCIMLHQACAEASAKAAAGGPQQQQQQQQPEASCMQQLLACLSNQCCGCGQRAASLQCAAPGCSRMFHVPCVQGMGASLSQDGACWCSEHQHVKLQQPAAGPFTVQDTGGEAATDATAAHAGLSSPEPTQAPGINPSPSFAAALVLQQMRCSTGFDVLLLGPDAQLGEPGADSSSGAGSSINATTAGASAGRGAAGRTRTSAHRRLLEAMPPSNGTSSTGPGPWQYSSSTARRDGSQAAGLYGSTAEASRQYHLEQQQQAAYGRPQGPPASAQRPAASMLLQRLQQQSGQTAWQQQEQQQHVGPTRRSPQSNKGRPPLHMPPGKPKGSWNTLGLVSAFALAQQQEEEARQQQEQQQQQRQLAASHAAAAAVVVSGPTVVVPRVRAKKGAAMHATQY